MGGAVFGKVVFIVLAFPIDIIYPKGPCAEILGYNNPECSLRKSRALRVDIQVCECFPVVF